MRVCPKCGHRDPPIWRPAKMHNPSGDIDIARITDVEFWQPQLGKVIQEKRGTVVLDEYFAYYIGKRGHWVRRVAIETYRDCGKTAFNPPYETSGHNTLAKNIFGKPNIGCFKK